VPKGFAHGYSVISETAEVFYKCDEYYYKESEGGIAYNDWGVDKNKAIISEKDLKHPGLKECKNNFVYEG
jgi:dTDP-4-dehydrorhamnose 3,5-epimerase